MSNPCLIQAYNSRNVRLTRTLFRTPHLLLLKSTTTSRALSSEVQLSVNRFASSSGAPFNFDSVQVFPCKALKQWRRSYSTSYHENRTASATSLQAESGERLYNGLTQSTSRKSTQEIQELYLGLVDYYDPSPVPVNLSNHSSKKPEPARRSISDGNNADGRLDVSSTHTNQTPRNEVEKQRVLHFEAILRDRSTTNEDLYTAYKRLPGRRAPYIGLSQLHSLANRLSVVEKKSESSMLRFFAVIEDMQKCGIPLSKLEWNSAISFAGRYVAKVTDEGLSRALHIWKDMESETCISSTNVTFNILFDVATKAKKFHLADLIREEMRERSLCTTRYMWAALIQNAGLRGDSESIRKHYTSLVLQGEVVDTVILNSMISAFLNCGEPTAAEQIYERMKLISCEGAERRAIPHDWQTRRSLANALLKAARSKAAERSLRKQYPLEFLVSPDIRTYEQLVWYHCTQSGNLEKIAGLVSDMQSYKVPVSEKIYSYLMQGFKHFGNKRYSLWTDEILNGVWEAFLEAVDGKDGMVLSETVVKWALEATLLVNGKSAVDRIENDVLIRRRSA